jgi:hypothetical protein
MSLIASAAEGRTLLISRRERVDVKVREKRRDLEDADFGICAAVRRHIVIAEGILFRALKDEVERGIESIERCGRGEVHITQYPMEL